MKFYFEGTLLRTSETHHYTHAIIKRTENGIKCIGCSSSAEGARKLMESHPTYHNYKVALSVQDGTYKQRNRWQNSLEYLRKNALERYGTLDAYVESRWESIKDWEIVKVEEA